MMFFSSHFLFSLQCTAVILLLLVHIDMIKKELKRSRFNPFFGSSMVLVNIHRELSLCSDTV